MCVLTAAVAASVADEVGLESMGKPDGTLVGRLFIVDAGRVDDAVGLEMFTGSFSIAFTG